MKLWDEAEEVGVGCNAAAFLQALIEEGPKAIERSHSLGAMAADVIAMNILRSRCLGGELFDRVRAALVEAFVKDGRELPPPMHLVYDNTYGGAEVTDCFEDMLQLTRMKPCGECGQLKKSDLRWRQVPAKHKRWRPYWLTDIPKNEVHATIQRYASTCPRKGGTLIVQTRGTHYGRQEEVIVLDYVDLAFQHTPEHVHETTNPTRPEGFPDRVTP